MSAYSNFRQHAVPDEESKLLTYSDTRVHGNIMVSVVICFCLHVKVGKGHRLANQIAGLNREKLVE